MPYDVLLTEGAERDLEEIHDYIAEFDSRAAADHVLDRLLEIAESLSKTPDRGSPPQELLAVGMREFTQVFFKPYRLIYQVLGERVVIHLIADGRRDMPGLLARRLLRDLTWRLHDTSWRSVDSAPQPQGLASQPPTGGARHEDRLCQSPRP